jgi:hypothetical protein
MLPNQHRMRALCLLLLLFTSSTWAKTEVTVNKSDDNIIHVQAQIFAAAPPRVAWEVLTDYEHFAAFVPNMASSRIISAPGEPQHVEQKGSMSFLLFSFPIEVVFEIDAKSSRGLHFHSVSGNLRDMTGGYRMAAISNGTRIFYEAQFKPDFWVPPLVSVTIMRNEIKRQFDGLVLEIERRYTAQQKVLLSQTE